MKKVILADRSYLIIKDSQEEGLAKKLEGTAKFRLHHLAGSDILDPKEVRRVTQAVAGIDYAAEQIQPLDEAHRISANVELTDEQRAANLKKIEKIKAKIRKDMENRAAQREQDKIDKRNAEREAEEKRKAAIREQGEKLLKEDEKWRKKRKKKQ